MIKKLIKKINKTLLDYFASLAKTVASQPSLSFVFRLCERLSEAIQSFTPSLRASLSSLRAIARQSSFLSLRTPTSVFAILRSNPFVFASVSAKQSSPFRLCERLNALSRSVVAFLLFLSLVLTPFNFVQSAFSPEINYQGKLTDSANVAVADGDYNIEFKLYDAATGGNLLWTETLTTTNKITVTSGLFSVLLGNVTDISGVDFNQNLYLGVNIGGSGTASWDGEMTPRKQIASVPSAFEAGKLDGVDSTQFLRSDEADELSASSATTLFKLVQSGAGAVATFVGGYFGIGTTTPTVLLTVGSTTPTHVAGYRDAFFAGDLEVDGSVYFDGTLDVSGTTTTKTLRLAPVGVQVITAATDTISSNYSIISLSADADYVMTSTPTIATSTAGTLIVLHNKGSFDIDLQANSVLLGSGIYNEGVDSIIEPNDLMTVMFFDDADGNGNAGWRVQSHPNPTAAAGSATTLDIRNISGSTVAKFKPVYAVSWNVGQGRINVDLADADDPTKIPAIGFTNGSISNNSNGQVLSSGEMMNVDTSSYSEGDTLYVDATAGGITTTRPSVDCVQALGKVLRSHATQGTVLVIGAGRCNDTDNEIVANSITTTLASSTQLTVSDKSWLGNLLATANSLIATNDSGVAIYDNASNGIFVKDGGNVGIGTVSPGSILHINGGTGDLSTGLSFGDGDSGLHESSDDVFVIAIAGANKYNINSSGIMPIATNSAQLRFVNGSATTPALANRDDLNTGIGWADADQLSLIAGGVEGIRITQNDAADDVITMNGNVGIGTTTPKGLFAVAVASSTAGTSFLVSASTGNVGLGIDSPAYQLQLSTDSAAKPGTATWTIDSDERLKDINGDFTRGLEALSELYPTYFNYKIGNARGIPSTREYVGLIAQDVQKVIPEAVREGVDGFLSVESDPIFWTMLNAIKELALQTGGDIISYNRNDNGEPQVKIAFDEDNYAEMEVSATGDLVISARGGDVSVLNENFKVCSGGACPSEASMMDGVGNLMVENIAFVAGALGVGTSSPDRAFNIFETSEQPQMKISYNEDNFAEMQVSATGDLVISARGGDVRLLDDNLMVCSGGACPINMGGLEGVGNLAVENTAYIAGALGVGTPAPSRGLDVFETQTNPQMRISYNEDLYSEFNVLATGDLVISARGGDVFVLNENFRVCSGDGCPSEVNALVGAGNLVVENNLLALGSIGINTAEPSYTLDVNGTLRAYGITDASDVRLKTNIRGLTSELSRTQTLATEGGFTNAEVGPLDSSTLSKINNLRGVIFEWKDKQFGEGGQIGMIAQEMEAVYPALVSTDDKGFKSIQYGKFTAVLLEAIKELFNWSETIEYRSARLENKMAELEKKNQVLEDKTIKLEARIHALEQILTK
ncbi:MAG: tail fiber domain-containing protein [Patescibacteria group bacterium]